MSESTDPKQADPKKSQTDEGEPHSTLGKQKHAGLDDPSHTDGESGNILTTQETTMARDEQARGEYVRAYIERPPCERLSKFLHRISVTVWKYNYWLRVPAFREAIEAADALRRQVALEPVRAHLNEIVAMQVQKAMDGNTAAAAFVMNIEGWLRETRASQDPHTSATIDEPHKPESLESALAAEQTSRAKFDKYRELEEAEYEVVPEGDSSRASNGNGSS